jgi:hypothetical protein
VVSGREQSEIEPLLCGQRCPEILACPTILDLSRNRAPHESLLRPMWSCKESGYQVG